MPGRVRAIVNYLCDSYRISIRLAVVALWGGFATTDRASAVKSSGSLALDTAAASAKSVDLAAGRKRAEVCMACHGETGRTKTAGTPHLASQNRESLIKALNAYRISKVRRDDDMTAMAKPLSDDDIQNIAAYFSSLQVGAR